MKGKKLGARERINKLRESPVERTKCFKKLLQHLATGYSIDCFTDLSEKSIKEFIEKYPEEFCEEELLDAVRDGKQYWEGLGVRQSNGTCMGNSRSWYYNMVNRYGWREKVDIKAEHSGQVSVAIIDYATHKASKGTPAA